MAPWFGPKSIGYGIGPSSGQGWLASILTAVVAIGGAVALRYLPALPRWVCFSLMVMPPLLLIVLISATYDPEAE